MTKPMTYASTGVDYDSLDPFKRAAQLAGLETAGNIARLNGGEFKEFPMSRGESVYLIEAAKSYFAHVNEGLGTKNVVADEMYRQRPSTQYVHEANDIVFAPTFYDKIAQDTVAMIVNDMITLGALPLSVAMHIAAGSSDWFKNRERVDDLIRGWKAACDKAGCTWGGGETPTLKGIINPNTVMLSGSAFGIIKPKERLIRGNIEDGDSIIIIESSGIHANGLTLAREIAKKLPDGYMTKLPNGRTYGETLLDPTHIYVPFVEACLDRGINIHYAVNITGHGWRKFMRSNEPFTYIIEAMPTRPQIFDFIQEHGNVSMSEMYGNFNMGAGFALYVPLLEVDAVLEVANELAEMQTIDALFCGYIKKSNEKKVIIEPMKLEFSEETLAVR